MVEGKAWKSGGHLPQQLCGGDIPFTTTIPSTNQPPACPSRSCGLTDWGERGWNLLQLFVRAGHSEAIMKFCCPIQHLTSVFVHLSHTLSSSHNCKVVSHVNDYGLATPLIGTPLAVVPQFQVVYILQIFKNPGKLGCCLRLNTSLLGPMATCPYTVRYFMATLENGDEFSHSVYQNSQLATQSYRKRCCIPLQLQSKQHA